MTKPAKWHVRPAKTQINLGICPDWSESLLYPWRKLGSLATHWVHSEGSDQTGRMPRLIRVFAGRTCHFVGFVMRYLNFVVVYPYFYKQHCSLGYFLNLDYFFRCLRTWSLHGGSKVGHADRYDQWSQTEGPGSRNARHLPEGYSSRQTGLEERLRVSSLQDKTTWTDVCLDLQPQV